MSYKYLIMAPVDPKVVDNVIKAVAAEYFMTDADILGDSRNRLICAARHVVDYILIVEYGYTLEAVGYHLNRNHTTIHAAVKQVSQLMQADQNNTLAMEFVNRVARIIEGLKNDLRS